MNAESQRLCLILKAGVMLYTFNVHNVLGTNWNE